MWLYHGPQFKGPNRVPSEEVAFNGQSAAKTRLHFLLPEFESVSLQTGQCNVIFLDTAKTVSAWICLHSPTTIWQLLTDCFTARPHVDLS